MDEYAIEIYRQRYETFRHLDKLRWMMLQILVAIASASALVLRSTDGAVEWWFYMLIGYSLIIVSASMNKISAGIQKNSIILSAFGKKIGDDNIPNAQNSTKSISFWLMLSAGLFGIFFFGKGVLMLAIGEG